MDEGSGGIVKVRHGRSSRTNSIITRGVLEEASVGSIVEQFVDLLKKDMEAQGSKNWTKWTALSKSFLLLKVINVTIVIDAEALIHVPAE